jgi:hypothetical protein
MSKYEALFAEFPDRFLLIRRSILNNSEFSAACDDYVACQGALEHWKTAPEGAPRVEEYTRILKELKEEIAGLLDKQNQRPRP